MKNKLLNAFTIVSLFLIPFLSKTQVLPVSGYYSVPGPLAVNNAPVAANDYMTMCQDAGTITIPVQSNDYDPDGDLLVTAVISGPSYGTATVVGTDVHYTPAPGFYGVDIIDYVICDNGIPSMCDTATIAVTVTQAPVADCGPDQTICFGDVTTIGTPAMAGNTYLWSPAAGLSSTTVAQPFCSPTVSSTTYTLSVHSMITGCNNTDMVTITVNPVPTADAGPDHTLCEHDSVQLGTPGTFGNTYYWTPIAPLNNNSIPQPMASPDTTTTFLLVVTTTATGCYSTDSTVVNIIQAPPTNAGPNKTICVGHSVVLGTPAVAGNTYSWSPALGLSSTTVAQPSASPVVSTTYVLTVTNTATGCTDKDSVTVIVNPPPLAVTGPNRTICAGDSVQLGAPQVFGNTYLWTPSTGLSADNVSNPYASPTVTTTYTLTESAGVGCSASNSVTVTVIPGAVANAGADVTVCTGASTVIGVPAVSGYTYVWTPALGLSSTIIAQPTASPSSTSTYILLVTNTATGCTATDTVTVTVVTPPNANAGPNRTICNGDTVIIGSPAIAGETYSWSPATGLSSATVAQPNAFPSSTTTYTLTATNAGCSDNDNVVVTVNPLPVANAGANATICLGQSHTLGSAAVAGNTYAWSPGTGLSSTTAAQPVATPTATTTYVLTMTNGTTGCTNSDTVTITVQPLPTANAGANATICAGNSTTIGTAAVGGFTYSWSPATGLSSTTVAQPTANPTTTTTYILTITNGTTLCQDSDTVTVTVVPAPVAFTGPAQSVCQGDSVQIGGAAIAGHTYSWSPATGLSATTISNPYASPTATTTYTLTETAGPGCSTTNSVTVTVLTPAVANAGPDASICIGSSTVIGTAAVSGSTYSWSPATGLSSTTIAQPTANPSVTTTYYLTVNNTATGCTDTDTMVVTVNPLPLAATGPDQTICNGDSVQIGAASIAGHTYSWSPATGLSASTISNPYANPTSTTTYTLTESAGPGCSNSNTITITVIAPAIADAGADQTTCTGSSVTIGTAATAGMTYSWSPATGLSSTTVAQPTANPSATTTYVLTVTNTATGCEKNDTVIVTINPQPLAATGPDRTLCMSDSVQIGATPIAGHTYSWSPTTDLSSSTVANPYANPTTTTTYTLTESAGPGCVSTNTVTITVVTPPVADAGSDQATCLGGSVTIGTAATSGMSYSWSPTTGLSSSTAAQPSANPTATTTYILTITNTTTGCTDTDTVIVTINTIAGVDAGADVTACADDSVMIGATAHAGSTYSWSPATGLSSTTVSNPMAHPGSTTTYILTETNSAGCSGTDTVTVSVDNSFTANAGADASTCLGTSVVIGTTPVSTYTYSWSPSAGLSSSTVAQPSANPSATTTYVLTVQNSATGCTATDTIVVTVNNLPVANAGVDRVICTSDTVSLGVAPVTGYTYSWSPTDGLSSSTVSNPSANPATTTTYILTCDDGVCTNRDTVVVTVNAFPELLAGPDQLICEGGNVVLGQSANNNYTYSWSPDYNLSSTTVAQPTASPTQTTVYTVYVVDTASNCATTENVLVTVQATGSYNGISPNGDGINDEWTIPMLDCYTNNTVTILNRWGAEVWKANNYDNDKVKWDGTNLKGESLPDGTYYYVIAFNDTEKRGWVFIKR